MPAMSIALTAVGTLVVFGVLRWYLYPRHPQIIPSPLKTVLAKFSSEEIAALPYKPDNFPGARDVPTPYGTIRVYEFGPEDGRKVIFVHGISTSCQTLGPVAEALVRLAGCRVMLFDLFGRGYSDGVGDLPHDARLYASQMLLAMASSPLSWTGNQACDIVGYSLGGGVAVHFASSFPHMVRSLVLLAPAGLIRPERFGVAQRLVFTSGIIPERLLAALTRQRMKTPISNNARSKEIYGVDDDKKKKETPVATASATAPASSDENHGAGAVDMVVSEAADAHGAAAESEPVEREGAALSARVMQYVRWMLTFHDGFVPAMMSCIRVAPLLGQRPAWEALAAVVSRDSERKLPLCVVLGRHDDVVNIADYEVDAKPLFATAEKLSWTYVPGGHEFPMTYSRPVLRAIFNFWGGLDSAIAVLQKEDGQEFHNAGNGAAALEAAA